MRLVIGSDHAGYELKTAINDYVQELGHATLDVGTDTTDPSDYPDYAEAVACSTEKYKALAMEALTYQADGNNQLNPTTQTP